MENLASPTIPTKMQAELNLVAALMMSGVVKYEELADRHSKKENCADESSILADTVKETIENVKKFCTEFLHKVLLLVPEKEETKAVVDQSNETRKRKRDEDEEPEKEDKQVVVRVHVPTEKMRFVAGKYYSNRDRLENKYRIHVTIPEKGGEEITLKGRADRVADAKEDILVNLPKDRKYVVEEKFVGSIIGRNGDRIKELRRYHKVNIEIRNKNEVIISGPVERCDAAWKEIKGILNRRKRDAEDRLCRDWY
jgi:predicted PilT family ATPase